ncbi:MAG: 1-deoxy-D-xylulose-5-phosphate synthase [Acidimicrobiales bacterium]|nr:1-deoxy-D-xylulose-5-phosphate synthase [Acidimicrobiales bacterium]
MHLDSIHSPDDLKKLSLAEVDELAAEIRQFIVEAVSVTGGHLGSNLGAVELTLAIHRVFDSPRDIILWDTGHQAYAHKIVTGRADRFTKLRQENGLSGYPNRIESEHDWVENSHASTILSYAHGLAVSVAKGTTERKVVSVIGDGSMTGGMAYEALNNLGHSGTPCVIVLNDNGRSYAPTVSSLTESVSRLRLNPQYLHFRKFGEQVAGDLPVVGQYVAKAWKGMTAAMREVAEPTVFFEALGVRYVGPIDGHDVAGLEDALRNAADFDGPIVVHVLTQKGRGYPPAEDDDEKCLHDAPTFDVATGPGVTELHPYTAAFSEAIVNEAARHPQVLGITAAMPGPTGLLPLQEQFPDRYFDVGIAEQHAVTMAAGMAMGGLRPVVALYSTFFTRAFDQANLDVGLHGLPVVFALDRAGITGDDGPSHHGILDMVLCQQIPGITMFAPSSVQELPEMLATALTLDGPASIRFPKGVARRVDPSEVGTGLNAKQWRSSATREVAIIGVGKMLTAALDAAQVLGDEGIDVTVWDPRIVKPLDPAMLTDAAAHRLVVTVEDGVRTGGIGSSVAAALADLSAGASGPSVVTLGVPDEYVPQAKPDAILARYGLDAAGVAETIRAALSATSLA